MQNTELPDYELNTYLHRVVCTLDVFPLVKRRNGEWAKPVCKLLNEFGDVATMDIALGRKNAPNSKYYRLWHMEPSHLGKAMTIEYGRRQGHFYMPAAMMTIHEPNWVQINFIDSIYNFLNITPTLSLAEMAFDFYSNDIIAVDSFLKQHLYLKHQYRPAMRVGDTIYTTNVRTSSKGTRTYIKEINSQDVCHFELELHRNVLRRNGVVFPELAFNELDLRRFFGFRSLQKDKVTWQLIKSNYEDDTHIRSLRDLPGGSSSLWLHQINSLLRTEHHDATLMEMKDKIKNELPCPFSRVLNPLHDVEEDFFYKVAQQSFIPLGPAN